MPKMAVNNYQVCLIYFSKDMDADSTILAIRQRSFDELCENINRQLEEGVRSDSVGEELKRQLSASSQELLSMIDQCIRTTQSVETRRLLAEAGETVRRMQRELAIKIVKDCVGEVTTRMDEPLMSSTMREVIAATGHMREPRVSKFDGSAEQWPTFRDLFISEVHQRYPDDITKLVYLQQLCTGEAKQTLGQWQPTAANYKLAWDTLCSRYEDERAIKQAAANVITTLQPVRSESRDGLRKLIDTTNNALRQLNAAGCPTAYWDELVISKWVECLPDATYRKWKRHLHGRSDVTFRELCEFVEVEARTCEDIERREWKSKSDRDHRSDRRDVQTGHFSVRREDRYYEQQAAQYVDNENTRSRTPQHDHRRENASTNRNEREPKCTICGDLHLPYRCEKFRQMSLQQRKNEIDKRKLCKRCLGDHHSNECSSSFVCRRCNQPHSALLCDKRPNETQHKSQY